MTKAYRMLLAAEREVKVSAQNSAKPCHIMPCQSSSQLTSIMCTRGASVNVHVWQVKPCISKYQRGTLITADKSYHKAMQGTDFSHRYGIILQGNTRDRL